MTYIITDPGSLSGKGFAEWLKANLHKLLQVGESPSVYLMGWHYTASSRYISSKDSDDG